MSHSLPPHVRHTVDWTRKYGIWQGIIDKQSIESFHELINRMWFRYCKVNTINGIKCMMQSVLVVTKPSNKVTKTEKKKT